MPAANAPTTPPVSKLKVFVRRLSSTIVLWGVIITALFCGNETVSNYFFLGIMLFLAAVGLWEFYALVEKEGLVCFKGCGIVGGLLLMFGTFLNVTGLVGTQGSPSRVNDFE